jgi:hypothetical protein
MSGSTGISSFTWGTGTVTFDYAQFAARYPEFDGVWSQAQATAFFVEATMYCDNERGSRIRDVAVRAVLLNMMTAHIAELARLDASGNLANPLVGRISNANEGSVSVAVDYKLTSAGQEWFAQTKYGAAFWQATAMYRRGRYYPGLQPVFDVMPLNTGPLGWR